MTELSSIHERLDAGGRIMSALKIEQDIQGQQIKEIHDALAVDLSDPKGRPGILVRMATLEMSLSRLWWTMGLLVTAVAIPLINNLWKSL